MEESYEAVVSLGSICAITEVLKELKLRTVSHPLDWLVTNHSFLVRSIERSWKDFELCDIKSLPPPQTGDDHYYFVSREYDALSLHEFDRKRPWEEQIDEVQAKFARRLQRYRDLFEGTKKTLLVRLAPPHDYWYPYIIREQDTPEKMVQLALLIEQKYPNFDFHILYLQDRGDIFLENPTKQTVAHPRVTMATRWNCEGYHRHSAQILAQIHFDLSDK